MSQLCHINRMRSCRCIPHYTGTLLCPNSATLTGCTTAAASHITQAHCYVHINRMLCCRFIPHYTGTLLCPNSAILTGCAAAAASYPVYTDALPCPNSVMLSGCAAAAASHATQIYCSVPTPPHYKDALLPLHPSSTQH